MPDEQDRKLLEEALICARGGAARAAYIMTWLAAAESLKRRFRELALRDGDAKRILGKVEEQETQHRAADRLLIEEAKGYGMLSDAEAIRLTAILTSRHLYAHPYETAPSAPVLVAAMDEVVGILLSRPTKLRHAFITRQIELVTTRRFASESTVTSLGQESFRRYDESLLGFALDRASRTFDPLWNDLTRSEDLRQGLWFVDGFVSENPMAAEALIDALDLLHRVPNGATLLLASPQLWPHLPGAAREIIVGNCTDLGAASISVERLIRLRDALVLTEEERGRVGDWLSRAPLVQLLGAGLPPADLAPAIVRDLMTGTFAVQNPAAAVLRDRKQLLTGVEPTEQSRLGRATIWAADRGAFIAKDLVRRAAADGADWEEPYLRGLVEGCLVDDDGDPWFRIEPVFIRLAIDALAQKVGVDATAAILLGMLPSQVPDVTLGLFGAARFIEGFKASTVSSSSAAPEILGRATSLDDAASDF